MQLFTATKKSNISGSNEAGVSLIETLIALGLLGLIAAAFLSGLFTVSRATILADEQATAESLARSQMEYVKSQDYIDYADPGHGSYDLILITTPANYSVEVATVPIDPNTGQPLLPEQDQGIQKITVTVERGDKSVFTIEDYKVYR